MRREETQQDAADVFEKTPAHAPAPVEDETLDLEESLLAAQTLSGLAQMEAQKLAAEKKERKNFTKETVDELKKWFACHLDHPYPDEEHKEELARKTGLNAAQVSSPFARFVATLPPAHNPHSVKRLLSRAGSTLFATPLVVWGRCEREFKTNADEALHVLGNYEMLAGELLVRER